MNDWTYLDEYHAMLPENIRERLVIDGDCLRWTGRINNSGYGIVYAQRKHWLAHRYIYRLLTGHTFSPKEVLHHETERNCRFRTCCNPYHLRPCTPRYNAQQVVPWNRLKTHCPRGHEYDALYTASDGYTRRYCLTCNRRTKSELKKRRGVKREH